MPLSLSGKLISAATLLAAAACASAPPPQPETEAVAQAVPVFDEALRLVPRRGLSPRNLAPGACGLFLWSQTDISRFVFFTEAASRRAAILLGEDEVPLRQTRAGGELFGEFNAELEFVDPSGTVTVDMAITPGDLVEGGQRIKSGRLAIMENGWRTVVPVLGVRSCQPVENPGVLRRQPPVNP